MLTRPDWHRIGRMRLRTTIIALIVLPVTLSVGLVGWLGIGWLEREAESRMREDIELIARALQQPLNRAIRQREPVLLEDSLQSAFEFGRVYGAHIYGRDGELLAGAGVGERRFSTERTEALDTLNPRSEGYAALGDDPTYAYFLPLTTQGGRIAAILQITRQPDSLRHMVGRIRVTGTAALAGLALLLSLIVIVGHRRAIGTPLNALARGMNQVADGQLDYRIVPTGPLETRELGEGFNNMLDRIERATDEIAERRGTQASLQADLQASRKLAAVGELSAGVAHQLGTPLSVLDGRAQGLLRRGDLDPRTRETLEDMRAEVTRISQTVRQLMDFARSRPLQRRNTRLSRVVTSAVDRVHEDPTAAGVTIERHGVVDEDDEPVLAIDGSRLEEALCNLLNNAVQAAPDGTIRVSLYNDANDSHIRVEDDGPGIPASERARLFEPFHTTKPVGSGTGLGLAVAHGVARSHGGELTLSAGDLPGACFDLRLPRRETEAPS
ncbi:sensor histidine kinase [Spiribacter vilamensis]|uniref:histidine kinase n=2 Tax=Spiribacter vilamensis TaxID=531306 RepID=A0A4Q8D0E8_9GAMM|nr:HAMP domain-containing sensor histidine kinase [Spiribacter vilamensis]RZU98763.1 HAMP domain-containing protein [Spiribacter vilamensis]TVO62215.1 HAMP domain-containing histidine kinase [Spiribacter vilamensis]